MIDPKNLVNLTCGIVADPEFVNDNILKMRVAVDYGGSEKGGSTSGYFNVTYYLSGDNPKNADFVRNQVKDGKMKKGSQITLTGRLCQERWTDDNGNREKVVIVAEGITYAGGGRPAEATTGTAGGTAVIAAPGDF